MNAHFAQVGKRIQFNEEKMGKIELKIIKNEEDIGLNFSDKLHSIETNLNSKV